MTQEASSRATAALQRGDSVAALDAYAQVLAQTPDDVDALIRSGIIHGQNGNLTEAASFLERAAALAPHLSDVHINLSKLALEKRDWLAAEQSARRAIALSPALALPYENLVVALKRQGRWEDAEREIETGLKHCPPPSNLYNVLGELRQRRGDIRAASRLSSRRR